MFPQLVEILDTHYIECRKNRRYAVTMPGTLCGVGVEVRNISRGGAQLACSVDDFSTIGSRLHEVVPVQVMAEPVLAFTGRLVYENQREGEHLIGIEFVQLTEQDRAELDAYIVTLD